MNKRNIVRSVLSINCHTTNQGKQKQKQNKTKKRKIERSKTRAKCSTQQTWKLTPASFFIIVLNYQVRLFFYFFLWGLLILFCYEDFYFYFYLFAYAYIYMDIYFFMPLSIVGPERWPSCPRLALVNTGDYSNCCFPNLMYNVL